MHYHTMSPCIASSTAGSSVEACQQVNDCYSDPLTYAVEYFTSSNGYNTLKPIGIAKDGHILWGPYNEDGSTWADCDVDLCNGRKINGYYGYMSTTFHPYFWGCWGPGNYNIYSQECSTNARSCSSSTPTDSGFLLTANLFLAVLLQFIYF